MIVKTAPRPSLGAAQMSGLLMKYFVLKPHGNDAYAAASRKAMRAYAAMMDTENPDLARDLREWADREQVDNLPEPK